MGPKAGLAIAATLLVLAFVPATAVAGSISGTAIDAVDKAGIEGIEVCAWSIPEEGEGDFGCAETGAGGVYSIAGLEADEYGVEFWPFELPYRLQFYDGRSEWFEADPVIVGAGETSGIDAELVPTGSIEGTVTATEDGLPVEEVEVCAYEAVSGEFAACGYTGVDGSYLLGVEEGEYKVEFWPGPSGRNLAFQFYDQRSRWSEADVVSVAEGEAETAVDAALPPGATIAGRVTSAATNLPLEEILVCSIDAAAGLLQLCTWTNPDGTYALRRHPAGTYKTGFSIDLAEWFGEGWSENDGFPTEFWNEQSTLAAANPIGLAAGATAAGIDARLGNPPAPPAAIATAPPAIAPTPAPRRPKKCRRGFRKKLVRGKRRCVRIHRRQRHRKRRRHIDARPHGAPMTPMGRLRIGQ